MHSGYCFDMARPTNALIVDDEAHVRAFMRLMLRELGIEQCWEAGDGVTAVQLAQLKEVNPNIAVVMATAQRAMNNVSESLRLGAVGYLLKHSPRDETLAALRDVIETLEDEGGAESSDAAPT